jgi:hypothetical protein
VEKNLFGYEMRYTSALLLSTACQKVKVQGYWFMGSSTIVSDLYGQFYGVALGTVPAAAFYAPDNRQCIMAGTA